MKIKTIFWICISLIFLQGLPLFLSIISPEFKLTLVSDAFGSNPSEDAIIIFNTFALVVGLLKGEPTAPLPVIIMCLITLSLFYYGSKKGTI